MDEFTERELHKRFSGTFCALGHRVRKGEQLMAQIRHVNAGMFDAHVAAPGGAFVRGALSTGEWEILPMPRQRLFNFQGRVYKFSRRPERQWQIGLCGQNSDVFDLLTAMLGCLADTHHIADMYADAFSTTHPMLEDLFFPKPAGSIAKAVELLSAPTVLATTITTSWALSESDVAGTYLLWYYEYIVGKINPEKGTVELVLPLYRQEVQDLFKRTGERYYEA